MLYKKQHMCYEMKCTKHVFDKNKDGAGAGGATIPQMVWVALLV